MTSRIAYPVIDTDKDVIDSRRDVSCSFSLVGVSGVLLLLMVMICDDVDGGGRWPAVAVGFADEFYFSPF